MIDWLQFLLADPVKDVGKATLLTKATSAAALCAMRIQFTFQLFPAISAHGVVCTLLLQRRSFDPYVVLVALKMSIE